MTKKKSNKKKIDIAIDGPSGSGKGSVSSALAKELGYKYLDAGSMYRALAYLLNEKGVTPDTFDPKHLEDYDVDFNHEGILVNGESVENQIRTADVGRLSAEFANEAEGFKPFVLKFQNDLVSNDKGGWVCDGRDMAQRVAPHADLKIYLHAPEEVRAKRRHNQLKQKEPHVNHAFEQILKQIRDRDEGDYNNEHAPFMRPEEAELEDSPYHHVVDSSNHTEESQFDYIKEIVDDLLKEEEN